MHKFEIPKEVYKSARVAAEAALKRIADGENELVSAEEFWRGLDHQIPQIDTEKRRKA